MEMEMVKKVCGLETVAFIFNTKANKSKRFCIQRLNKNN